MSLTARVGIAVATAVLGVGSSFAGAAGTDQHVDRDQQRAPAASSGHFHALASPYSATATLTAHGNATVQLGGKGGLPTSALRAVTATLVSVRPKGTADIYAGATSTRPGVPALITGSAATSSFGVLPVSAHGALHLFGGAHATGVHVVVSGWFSSAREAGTDGLLNQLPGRPMPADEVGAGESRSISALGQAGVPGAHVSALLLQVAVTGAKASGSIGLAASPAGAKKAVSIAYSKFGAADLVLVRLHKGKFTLRNAGAKRATVVASPVAWFTSGASTQHGDSLYLSKQPRSLLAAHAITRAESVVKTAGIGGIPSVGGTTPVSLALWRTQTGAVSQDSTLTVQPSGDGRSNVVSRRLRKGSTSSGLVLAPPGEDDSATVYLSTGKAKLTAEAYAWFRGGLRIADTAQILDSAATADVSDVQPDSVTFSGHPDSLADLAPGDTLVTGSSPATPHGLLRRVVSVDTSGADLVVQTTQAQLTDVIEQGSFSTGDAASEPVDPAAPARVRRSSRRSGASCDAGGSLLFGGVSVSCTASFDEGPFSADVNAQANAGLGLDVSVGFGLPPKIEATTTLSVSAGAGASFTATEAKDLDEVHDFPTRHLAPIDFQIGPVPVVIEPEIAASVKLTGHVEATFEASATTNASLTTVCSTANGCSVNHDVGGDGSAEYHADLSAEARASFVPTVKGLLYGVAGVEASLTPYVEADADSCLITVDGGVDLNVGVELSVLDETIAEADATLPVVKKELARFPLRNCTWWSGSLKVRMTRDYETHGNDGTSYTDKGHGTYTLTIDDVGRRPPDDGYHMSGPGSGADIITSVQQFCLVGLQTGVSSLDWDGPVLNASGSVEIDANPHYTNVGTKYRFGSTAFNTVAPGVETDDGWEAQGQNCVATHESTDHEFVTHFPANDFAFHIPNGSNTASGSFNVDTPPNADDYAYKVIWSFTKHCLKGGTKCH